MYRIKKHKGIIIASVIFAIIYSAISFVNHYCFRTNALDLGLYTNAAYKYAHFQLADNSMIKEYFEPILGGHFDLYILLFSPLVYIFGTYSLLVLQIVAILAGGVGVYRYFIVIKKRKIALFAAIYFYLFFGVYGALAFDYHSVVVAASVLPWFFVAIKQDRKMLSVALLLFMLISQENFSIFLFFVGIALAVGYRKDRKKIYLTLSFSGISLFYYILISSWLIPFFSYNNAYGGFNYSYLGTNGFDAVKTLLTHPLESIKVLFVNHNGSEHGDFVKLETHLILLASGLFFLFKKPHFLIMLIPLYMQKFFHDNYLLWSVVGQYNIEFAPIFTLGIFTVISEIKNPKYAKYISYLAIVLVGISTFRTMDNTVVHTSKSHIRFYQKSHYKRDFDLKSVHRVLSQIPKNAAVSAQSPFVPHFSLRSNIYLFPIVKDAEYIIYLEGYNTYPLSQNEFENKIENYRNSPDWELILDEDVKILKNTSY